MAKKYYTANEISCLPENPKHRNVIDLTGKKYGELTVIKYADVHKTNSRWFAQCSCGLIIKVQGFDLKSGDTTSCGCFRSIVSAKRQTIDERTKTPEYRIYSQIKQRCENPKNDAYPRYGGRGITLGLTYEEFIKEVGNRPSKEYSIERLDNEKSYEKGNLAWVDKVTQANNKRSNRCLAINGETKTLAQWTGGSDTKLYFKAHTRLSRNWCPECAISDKPSCPHRSKTP